MRFQLAFFLFCAACNDSGDPPELLIDIQVSDDAVIVQAQEPALGCECSFGWTEVGTCRTQSDAFSCSCDPWPASCLADIAVVDAAGVELASADWDPMWWAAFLSFDTGAAAEVVITGCGAEASAHVPPAPRPAATIEVADDVIATWSSSPVAASSIVMLGDGSATDSCHRTGGSGTVDASEAGRVAITALAEPRIEETELGTVRVWSGNTTELTR